MLQFALRTLRFRAGMFVAAFLAMFFAAAIMMACGGLIETGIRTAVPPRQLDSADVVVTGDQEYHDSGGDLDEPPILPERVRIDAGLAGTIAALPGVRKAESFVFEGVAPTGTVDAIGVVAEPGVDIRELQERIDAKLDRGTITLVGDERGQAELREAKASGVTVMALAGVFTAFAILVSIFGVAAMLALSIAQRQQDLALLRAVGATPRQLRRLILRETLLLSLLATALAYFPGQFLGEFVFDRLAERGIAADGVVFHQGWLPTVAAMVVAIVAAVAGALGAGRRASRVKPTQALTEVSVEGRPIGAGRMLLAVIFLAGGVALTIVTIAVISGPLTPATAAPAVILLAIGFALLAPVLTKLTTFAVQWPVRALGGVTGQLAVLNARGRSGRMAAVMGPVILLTAVSTGMLYLQTTNDEADRRSFADNLVADAVVTAQDRVDADLVAQINDLPGVAGASAYVTSVGFIENPDDSSPANEGWTLQGVTAEGATATTPVEVTAGTIADLHDDTIAIGNQHADKLGVDIGDTITLRMGDNTPLDVRVAALFSAPDDYDTLLLPADTLAAHTTEGYAKRILVKFGENTDPERLMADLTEVTSAADGLTVAGRDVLFGEYDAQKTTANFAIYIMVLMIAGYAAITVINTLASSTTARRREFGLQRLAGSTRGQVMRMVGLEGAILAVSGIALGTVAAIGILVPVSVKRLDSVLPAGSPWIYVSTAALTVLLTFGATLLPAWRATRRRPAEAALAIE
ncbi:ABC transporter permease [Kibdelosporangium persicum]|uniref:Outer membrane-specific lipoprotein transporter subunit LolC n=1 Tax=Kibdelosporangium persicum TaxID=2698649 RepID=A0ABX2F7P2_9PSEU|nr:ABC transporter permease [Kibdelosporangium persicum]NRN67371.1 Outer membrane-specific lipoprotein transporter subunit LolC [Kibdelosporangium persicum]